MTYTEHYDNLVERQQHIVVAEADGFVMLHDDFDIDWKVGDEPHGTLTFTDPIPKSDEELAEETEQATCGEYLSHSSDVIKLPEIWFLLRAFAKKLGYKVE